VRKSDSIRGSGAVRLKGKDFVMQDSDVCNFLFDV